MINNLLGLEISKTEMVKILEALEVKVNGDNLEIPYFRTDLQKTADIAEEVIRIYGYDKLESTLINAESTLGENNNHQKLQYKVK